MKFIQKLTFIKTLLLPTTALVVWGIFLAILFNSPSSLVNRFGDIVDFIPYTLFIIFCILNLLLAIYLVSKKNYRLLLALVLGFIITSLLFIPETILFFGIGIAGGATG